MRNRNLTIIRVVSCFAIVVLHTAFACVGFDMEAGNMTASYLIRNLMYFAVPCFVMVSGALLLDGNREMPLKKIYGRYVRRVLLALLIFTALYLAYDTCTKGGTVSAKDLFLTYGKQILTDGSWVNLWYLYMLLGLYLLLPAYRAAYNGMSNEETRALIVVWFLFQSVVPFLEKTTGLDIAFYVGTYTIYPFYFFLGRFLYERRGKKGEWKTGAVFFAIGCAAIAYFSVQASVLMASDAEAGRSAMRTIASYGHPAVVLLSAGAFLILANLPKREKTGLVDVLDADSFGIYLIHMIPLKAVIAGLKWNPFEHGGVPMVILLSAGIFLVSWGVSHVLRLIRPVRQVL